MPEREKQQKYISDKKKQPELKTGTEVKKQQKMSDNWKEELNISLLQRRLVIYTSHKRSEGKREREQKCKAWQCAWSAGNI